MVSQRWVARNQLLTDCKSNPAPLPPAILANIHMPAGAWQCDYLVVSTCTADRGIPSPLIGQLSRLQGALYRRCRLNTVCIACNFQSCILHPTHTARWPPERSVSQRQRGPRIRRRRGRPCRPSRYFQRLRNRKNQGPATRELRQRANAALRRSAGTSTTTPSWKTTSTAYIPPFMPSDQ
jgi:hypothetical protein